MELVLNRRWRTDKTSIGELFIDGVFECFTLEDKTRAPDEPKVFGETAIPTGRYEVRITHSPKFGVDMPLLLDVPGFSGVRIHSGNKAEDTEGCILVGQHAAYDEVLDSRLAYSALFPKLQAVLDKGEQVFITVKGEVAVDAAVPVE